MGAVTLSRKACRTLNFKNLWAKEEKEMKKIKAFAAALLALAVLLLCLTACGGVSESGYAAVVVETENEGDIKYLVFSVNLDELTDKSQGVYSVLEHLLADADSGFTYEIEGTYITSVMGVTPDSSKHEYIAIYTNEKADFAVPDAWTPVVPTVDYNGSTLTSSGLGVHSMTVNDGTVILFRMETWQ